MAELPDAGPAAARLQRWTATPPPRLQRLRGHRPAAWATLVNSIEALLLAILLMLEAMAELMIPLFAPRDDARDEPSHRGSYLDAFDDDVDTVRPHPTPPSCAGSWP